MQRKIPWVTLAIAAIASTFWIVIGSMVVSHAQTHDFLATYTAGRMARQGDLSRLYDLDFQRLLQKQLLPDAPAWAPIIRPPLFAVLVAPFTLLPLVPAYWIWLGSQILALLGCWAWAARKFGSDALVYCAFFMPAAVGLAHGEDNVWMLVLVVLAYTLAERELDFAAGAVLAVGLVKFHLLLLFPLVLLFEKRWRMLVAFSLTGLLEAIASFALIGASGFRQYYNLLSRSDLQALAEGRWAMLDVQALALNAGLNSGWWAAPLILMVVALVLTACWRAPLWCWFSAAATGSLLISPHVYKYDATLLLLPVLLAIFYSGSKFTRIAAATAVIPIPYLLTVAGPPIAAIPALTLLTFLAALSYESYRARETSGSTCKAVWSAVRCTTTPV
ncbi:MAG TPA: glycosyltransferase family 87 protein [Bryobacteraceae bacterium]|nr:glycosyltransferase family 87 protein [Bryobacteraceae bacterium]